MYQSAAKLRKKIRSEASWRKNLLTDFNYGMPWILSRVTWLLSVIVMTDRLPYGA